MFSDRLEAAISQSKRQGLIAVHCLDLDGFKIVNDSTGHKAGDYVLVCAANRLAASFRAGDTVARLGGDEFAIVQTGLNDVEDAELLATRVLGTFEEPVDLRGRQIKLGVSIGIAFAPQDAVTLDELMFKADSALYRSKSSGRRRYTVHRS